MTLITSIAAGAPAEMSPSEYALWQTSIRRRCGLHFGESRRRFLSQRLWERMQTRSLTDYGEYFYFVEHNPEGSHEWKELLEHLVVNETSFFRHPPSFKAFATHALPQIMRAKRDRQDHVLNIWSAACAAGQEAYSLAMTLSETLDTSLLQARVWGTDISPRVLERARQGSYRTHEMRHLPEGFVSRYFTKTGTASVASYKVVERLRRLVVFKTVNLVGDADYPLPKQDVIFCQNVLIYFEMESRTQIVRRLCERLNRGGYLFLAPGEMLGLASTGIEPIKIEDAIIYRCTNE